MWPVPLFLRDPYLPGRPHHTPLGSLSWSPMHVGQSREGNVPAAVPEDGLRFQGSTAPSGSALPAANGCRMSSGGGRGAQMALGVPSGVREISRVLGPGPGPPDMLGELWDGALRWWSRYKKRQQKSGAMLSRPRPSLCTQIPISTRAWQLPQGMCQSACPFSCQCLLVSGEGRCLWCSLVGLHHQLPVWKASAPRESVDQGCSESMALG